MQDFESLTLVGVLTASLVLSFYTKEKIWNSKHKLNVRNLVQQLLVVTFHSLSVRSFEAVAIVTVCSPDYSTKQDNNSIIVLRVNIMEHYAYKLDLNVQDVHQAKAFP